MNNPDILVIDDEPQIQKLLKIVLENNGYRVEQARKAVEGISLAASKQPALILLDIELPDGNGMDLLMELKLLIYVLAGILILTRYTAPCHCR